ncbi:class D sortase [Aneurinibacillus tyrosinisolvens]|uniref:class D sortase n=1 Tax=Aneurinibacillus tyrosinisolvens TaxID=1443435 RepID=UPI00063FA933|nr:class D sortase [Aneurinibacillus tyrosinisolvens]
MRFLSKNKVPVFLLLLSLLTCGWAGIEIYVLEHRADQKVKEWESKQLQKAIQIPQNRTRATEKTAEENKKKAHANIGKGNVIGLLELPVSDKKLPIIEGTDERSLSEGIGHYEGTALPGEKDNAVLAGHRDTVFKKLGEVKKGDLIRIETESGVYQYKVSDYKIVDSDDTTVIMPSDKSMVTLITCYPFHFVGPAPKRYILYAELERQGENL